MSTLKNKVNLIGRVGAKPESQVFESGAKRARMAIATNERYKDKKGDWVDNTQWHNVVAWGSTVDRVVKALDKGSEVVIEGRLVNRNFEDKHGEKRYVTEIELSDFVIVNRKNDPKTETTKA